MRTAQLTSPQRIDLIVNGPVGRPGVDRRVGSLWDDDDHRRDAYEANRDWLLGRFYGTPPAPPPSAAIDYEDDPGFIRDAIAYFLGRARGEGSAAVAALEVLEGEPGDAAEARRLYRGRVLL